MHNVQVREQFKVDLRGIVDILSHHLYSGERVFLRELIQNGRDAIEARRRMDETHRGTISITSSHGGEPMVVHDDGVGLTDEDMRQLLATIGASSKRDALETTRSKFLGQFGIGLLSCFLIADEIDVRSRSARTPDAPTIHWVGHGDGTFTIAQAAVPLDAPGTEVRIKPRHGEGEWASRETLRQLVTMYAEHLDVAVAVDGENLTQRTQPWDLPVEDQLQWCRDNLGFDPMGIIVLHVSSLNVKGLGFVLPYTSAPGHRTGDRIYSRQMLVADTDDQLLPDWAFFCRAVVDAGNLPLTASREALQQTHALRMVRSQMGQRILAELIKVHGEYPEVYADIVRLHATGLKSLAVNGLDLRVLVSSTLPFRSTQGELTIERLQERETPVTFVADVEKYDAMHDIAVRSNKLLVDASGPHDAALLRTFTTPDGRPAFVEANLETLISMVQPADPSDRRAAVRLAGRATQLLAEEHVSVQVSSFQPPQRPVIWWPAQATLDGSSSDSSAASTLVLNGDNPAIQAMLRSEVPDESLDALLRLLHLIAMLNGRARPSIEQTDASGLAVQDLVMTTAELHEWATRAQAEHASQSADGHVPDHVDAFEH